MIQDHIAQIQARVENSAGMPAETKADLLNLLAALKSEVGTLSETHEEAASSVARFAAASAHEATRTEQKPELLEAALSGLTKSVDGLENSNPELTQIVNRIAVTLSNMGI
ncbi:MAG: putative cytosolic protein [Chthoniobacteraceae bacterium]|nr:putative cytosolic protein [Chthoniobacteraceae bacterium]